MSGGSFHYLHADVGDLMKRRDDVKRMAEFLAQLGHADAAECTRRVLFLADLMEAEALRLHDVWHAAEWFLSADYGEDQLNAALSEWRAAGRDP